MKKILSLLFFSGLLVSCKSSQDLKNTFFTSVKIDTFFTDKISIRAIAIDEDKVYFAGNKSRVGYIRLEKLNNKINQALVYDTIDYEYRSIAVNSKAVFTLNVGNPAKLSKFPKNLMNDKVIVYEEHNEKVFYDSMQFWNEQEGIAVGDPIENCLSIIITRDGGQTWNKLSCEKLPKILDGEAAFAASNTNIVVKGNSTWIVSGGKKARVFYSPDKGFSWNVFETPIVQGETMTGIFTADFYNDKIGFIAGGNYEKPNQNFQNKALTTDGGKTWKLVGEKQGFGYASCVQFVPNSNGEQLVSVGASGLYYSKDKGKTWIQLSTDATLYTIRFFNDETAIAAGKDKIVKIVFVK